LSNLTDQLPRLCQWAAWSPALFVSCWAPHRWHFQAARSRTHLLSAASAGVILISPTPRLSHGLQPFLAPVPSDDLGSYLRVFHRADQTKAAVHAGQDVEAGLVFACHTGTSSCPGHQSHSPGSKYCVPHLGHSCVARAAAGASPAFQSPRASKPFIASPISTRAKPPCK
jgi:hypothetical protein